MDIHPQPDPSKIEVQVAGRTIPVGRVDEADLIEGIHAARRVLASTVEAGHFAFEKERAFEFLYHFDTVDACLSFLAEDDWGELDPTIVSRARDLLAKGEGEILMRESVRAARLRQL